MQPKLAELTSKGFWDSIFTLLIQRGMSVALATEEANKALEARKALAVV